MKYIVLQSQIEGKKKRKYITYERNNNKILLLSSINNRRECLCGVLCVCPDHSREQRQVVLWDDEWGKNKTHNNTNNLMTLTSDIDLNTKQQSKESKHKN